METALIEAKYDGLTFQSLKLDYWTGKTDECFSADYIRWRTILGVRGSIDEGFKQDIQMYLVEWASAATPKEITLAMEMNVAGQFDKRVISYNELTRPVIAEIIEQYSIHRDKAQKKMNEKLLSLQAPKTVEVSRAQTDRLIWGEIIKDADLIKRQLPIDFYDLKYAFLERTGKRVFTAEEKIVAFEKAEKIPPSQFVYPILNKEKYEDIKQMRIFIAKKELYIGYLKSL